MAEDFERASSADYESLTSQTVDPGLAALFRSLAAEEAGHLTAIRHTLAEHGPSTWAAGGLTPVRTMPSQTASPGANPTEAVAQAVSHERATAGFYRELAAAAPLPSLRKAFAALAAEEESHAARLEDFAKCADQMRG
jgi:rubrerythrin